jgi:hypothetical protein
MMFVASNKIKTKKGKRQEEGRKGTCPLSPKIEVDLSNPVFETRRLYTLEPGFLVNDHLQHQL